MKYMAEAEARILQMMEEEEALYNEVQAKKRQFLLMEKKRLVNELVDLQVRKQPTFCSDLLNMWPV